MNANPVLDPPNSSAGWKSGPGAIAAAVSCGTIGVRSAPVSSILNSRTNCVSTPGCDARSLPWTRNQNKHVSVGMGKGGGGDLRLAETQ